MNKYILLFTISASILLVTVLTLGYFLVTGNFPDDKYSNYFIISFIGSMFTLLFSFSRLPNKSPEELKAWFEPCVCGHGRQIHLNSFTMMFGKEQLRNCENSDCECREYDVRK